MQLNACAEDTLFLRKMAYDFTPLNEKNVSSCFHFQCFRVVPHHGCAKTLGLCKYLFVAQVFIASLATEFVAVLSFDLLLNFPLGDAIVRCLARCRTPLWQCMVSLFTPKYASSPSIH
jgi:hypothetical protein